MDIDTTTTVLLADGSEAISLTPEDLRSLSRTHYWFMMALGFLPLLGAALDHSPTITMWVVSALVSAVNWGYFGYVLRDWRK